MPFLMYSLDTPDERSEHPIDALERLAAIRHWSFLRAEDNELSVCVQGRWSSYQLAFTWIEDLEALHAACAFDLKVPDHRRPDLLQLISHINEQMWVGHFDLWSRENVVMFRHSLLLAGGAEPNPAQYDVLMKVAVDAADRYYQAFQFVLWAGKSPREAMESVLFETEGQA
jgi:hypothetical protein